MNEIATKTCLISSPVGLLELQADKDNLIQLLFKKTQIRDIASHGKNTLFNESQSPILKEATRQLKDYFSGKRRKFDLPLKPAGTVFQIKAWQALCKIPYGKTINYKEQASNIGLVKAVRAVGSANARNPIPIIIPCHRVISSTGKLSGYAGGTKIKAALLQLEGFNFFKVT